MPRPSYPSAPRIFKFRFAGLLLASLAIHAPALADSVGLVLSGGGARGLAHIGAIKALEEQGIRVNAIAATSMGAVVGALYASGRTPAEMAYIATHLDWGEAFSDQPQREKLSFRRKQDSRKYLVKAHATFDGGQLKLPKGIVQGQNLQLILQRQFVHVSHITNFDELPIPFRLVAADIVTGDAVVISSGSLPLAARASMSVPGIYAPVELEGHMLVDGGIANNLPVDVAKAMGVDRIIAIDITSPLLDAAELDSVIPIIEQLTTLLTFNQMKPQLALLGPEDVLVQPDLTGIPASAFSNPEAVIERGYEAVMMMRSQLAPLAAATELVEITRTPASAPTTVTSISIDNNSSVSDDLIRAQISQAVGTALDRDQLEEDLDSIYGYQYFESVSYRLARTPAGTGTLLITAREKSWGSDLLGFSLDMFTDSDGDASYNIAANYRKARLTRRGGEWFSVAQIGHETALRTELYLPIDFRQRLFLRPYGRYEERLIVESQNGKRISRIDVTDGFGGIFVGVEASNKVVSGIGIETHQGKSETAIGANRLSDNFRYQSTYLKLEVDTLNNLYFPNEGVLAELRYDKIRPTGLDPRFGVLKAHLTGAFALGEHSLVLRTRLVRSDNELTGAHHQTRIGGFLHLSGLTGDSLSGSNELYASLTFLRRLDKQSILPVDLPLYLGVSIEGGNVWNDYNEISSKDLISAASLMLALDTPMGPIYFGWGKADLGESAFYLKLGRLF